jgi:hypothetical protein
MYQRNVLAWEADHDLLTNSRKPVKMRDAKKVVKKGKKKAEKTIHRRAAVLSVK